MPSKKKAGSDALDVFESLAAIFAQDEGNFFEKMNALSAVANCLQIPSSTFQSIITGSRSGTGKRKSKRNIKDEDYNPGSSKKAAKSSSKASSSPLQIQVFSDPIFQRLDKQLIDELMALKDRPTTLNADTALDMLVRVREHKMVLNQRYDEIAD
ncbi:hypothetical protein J8273_5999 [Carpediemonas membranifera]|uniref:Uncharacterized protein n=1 Tax=Carpediemonas membranifera TaxID=201153 RepID=A0A8J6B4C3_9EUKA|nr:hypothetical protein J8273_5999 [Carpediemonas membranifera]|eukprot:KAG9392642.1 hypothetical protein J8273_5999 [Carpediemonas membranifera]